MNANTAKTLLSLLVIAGCAGLALYLVRGPGPGFDPAPHRAIGKALADEALALGGDGRIVLIARDVTRPFPTLPAPRKSKLWRKPSAERTSHHPNQSHEGRPSPCSAISTGRLRRVAAQVKR